MKGFQEYLVRLEKLADQKQGYKLEAYGFVMAALHETLKKLPERRHINGKELLEGIRTYALQQYGPLSRLVLNYWGIQSTLDFGKMVFTLVDAGLMSKTREDSLKDFEGVYRFEDVFERTTTDWLLDDPA